MNTQPVILIIDDDKSVTEVLRHALRSFGEIITVHNGADALDVLAHTIPDVALVDLLLPRGMSGVELIQRMRASTDQRKIPVIAISAGNTELLVNAQDAGADLIIRKPFNLSDLQRQVALLLNLVIS